MTGSENPQSVPRHRWGNGFQSLISNPYLLVILLVAAILRMGWPAITEFKADEARLLALALDMAEFKTFALRGIGSSVGFPNFPMSVWLYALPLFIWKHPYAATLFVGALNTAAVYLGYRITRRYWGEAAALTAALMFAVSPWAVIYSRKIWAQDLLPLFVLGYIGSALAAFVDKRRWFLLLHLVLLGVIVQIHLSGAALVVLTALLFVIYWRTVLAAWKEVALGGGLALLMAAPFGVWLATHASGSGTNVAGSVLARSFEIGADALRYSWMVLCGFDIHSLAGPNAFQDYLSTVPNIDIVRWLWGLLALVGLVIALRRRQPTDLILVLWLVVPVLFFTPHITAVFPHYFIITLPAGYMLAGIAVGKLVSYRSQWVPLAIELLLPATALAQAGVWLTLLCFIATHETPNGFGTPLGALLNTVDAAKQQKADWNFSEVLVVGEGDDPSEDEFPAVMNVLLRDVPHRFVNGNEAVVVPQGGAAIILQSPLLRTNDWYMTCAREQGCVRQEVERGLAVVSVPSGTTVQVATPFPEPRRLANGVELIGWEESPVWTVIWRPGFVPAAADYHFFNHAQNGQVDGAGYPSRYWRDGDVYLSFFDFQPSGPVRVGMYEYPAVTNVPVLDEAGLPYSDAVTAER